LGPVLLVHPLTLMRRSTNGSSAYAEESDGPQGDGGESPGGANTHEGKDQRSGDG